jgi:Xaa-Pro aminopeptidase
MALDRLTKLQNHMREAKVDLVAIGPTANMQYLLGFAPHADERVCLLLVRPDDVRMVAPSLNCEEIAAHTHVELVPWTDVDGPQAALRQALGSKTMLGALAVDGATRADFLIHLQANVTSQKTISADSLVAPLRQCKSADEIELLAQAAAQADKAMQAAVDACHVGATESEIAWAAEAAFRKHGADVVDFTIVAAGANGAFPHHHAGSTQLKNGDAIVIDIGATYRGYKSDITRMVHLGKPTQEFTRAYAAVLEANQRAMSAVRPGIVAEEIDRAARDTLDAAKLGQYFTHRTGHGIGLDGHEPPWMMHGNKIVLEEGMTFSIEPGIYFVGQYGIRIEDIVAVTTTGVRNLTGFDHALVVKD